MKILKWFGIVLFIIVALFLLIPIFLPSNSHIKRSTVIKRPVNTVFQTAVDMNQRAKWDPWIEMEPNAEVIVNINPKIIGSGYTWEGNIIGKGKITITDFIPNQLIKSKIEFISPQSMKATAIWNFTKKDDSTIITWALESKLSYPIEKWFRLFMDKSLGSQFEKGLSNFKSLVESLPDKTGRTGEIKETKFKGFIALTIKEKIKKSKLEYKMIDIYSTLMVFIKKNDLEITGLPFSIYHEYDILKDSVLIELGFPINKKVKCSDNINFIQIPKCKTVTASHFGHFFTIKTTCNTLKDYISEHNLEITGKPWEIYMTDPFKEKDQAKWETQIYFPVK